MTRDSRPRLKLPLKHQQGNTLTGIVIGLIVGLVIAVAVALAITKGATPFTDKTGKAGKMGEPTAGQAADPNKPLYGNKEAARAANKQITDKPKAATPAEADPLGAAIANMKEKPALAPAPAPAPAPTQVAAAPSAQNVTPTAAAEPAEEKITYYLQAGAFREVADAENTRAKLALLGFEAVISERANDSGVLHRVRIGPYGQVEAMNKARAKLVDAGIDVAIVRNQK
ncbi:SPOR domain-containing protein [Massilia pseudoviolaceinigra]|uniref:SPOR domain-containing protein n=1 Tax=Massilia pseudoviolaceinigra TaxID=3057165 RepID=UPI002796B1E3|nr:SPOR domain-containing protein [Massilia sp. CCM 9206]MDQ1922121.1 SPOR domain-containing protein [Massilia sp. CCM 9206]